MNPYSGTYHENAKHFGHQPPVSRYSRPVLHQLLLRALYVVNYVLRVGIYSLYLFAIEVSSKRFLNERNARTPVPEP